PVEVSLRLQRELFRRLLRLDGFHKYLGETETHDRECINRYVVDQKPFGNERFPRIASRRPLCAKLFRRILGSHRLYHLLHRRVYDSLFELYADGLVDNICLVWNYVIVDRDRGAYILEIGRGGRSIRLCLLHLDIHPDNFLHYRYPDMQPFVKHVLLNSAKINDNPSFTRPNLNPWIY